MSGQQRSFRALIRRGSHDGTAIEVWVASPELPVWIAILGPRGGLLAQVSFTERSQFDDLIHALQRARDIVSERED